MKRALLGAIVAGVLFLGTAPANADTIFFTANLAGANEVPPNGSPGTGSALLTLNDVAQTLFVSLTFSGLTTPDTAGHIHCCAPLGTNAAVALPFFASSGFPTGVTAGSFSYTFVLATDLSGITPAAFIAGLESSQAYVNIHSSTFPGGEIRGQVTAVPEPGTASLMLIGIGLVLVMRKRIGQGLSLVSRTHCSLSHPAHH